MARMTRPKLRTLVPVLVAILLVGIGTAAAWYRATVPSDGTSAGYVTTGLSGDGAVVQPLPGAATALEPDDVVTAIEGIGLETWLRGEAGQAPPAQVSGTQVGYRVLRPTAVDVTVTLGPYPLAAVARDAWSTLLLLAVWAGMATFVYWGRPQTSGAGALLVATAGLVGSTLAWIMGFQTIDLAWRGGFWVWSIAVLGVYAVFWSAVLHFGLVFPSRLIRHGSLIVPLIYGAPLVATFGWVVTAAAATGSVLDALGSATNVQTVLVLIAVVVLIALYIHRYRITREPRVRDQVRWMTWGASISLTLTAAFWFIPSLVIGRSLLPASAIGLPGLIFPISVAVAVMRHHLFDIDVVINRSLVYGALTAMVVTVYVTTVTAIISLLGGGGVAASLLATGAAALVSLPLRDRLQRGVNRLMYGDRDDPYRAISRLADRLSASLSTEEVLPTVVATVASALKLPYAAIELRQDGTVSIAAAAGSRPDGPLTRLPLMDRGEVIGELTVAPRSANEQFAAADRELLAGLAREAGRAARSVRMAAEIDRSRRQVVAAREEERRRLRRDLHDGLGPSLAAARLKVQAARSVSPTQPDRADALLDGLDADLADLLDEVRRISRDLRPPVLDELGLMPALRVRAAQFADEANLEVIVDGPDDLPALPAAVEAAAFRIAVEALTNVRRHSRARRCAVRVRLADALEIEVADDGVGIAPGAPAGVGLVSMRERASEVGGVCEIEGGSAGTRVVASLPVAAEGTM